MKYFFTLAFLLLTTFCLFAQNNASFLIKGTLHDEEKNPVSYANVALYVVKDSSLVTGAVSGDDGKFEISAKPGSYYIKITFLSFEEKKITGIKVVDKEVNLGTVVLKNSAKTLEEVVVQGEKSQMELALDKKVFNVGKDLANAGGTATDILRNVPSVAVDVEGNVSLRGSGNVRILIDGKPSGLVSIRGGSGLQQLQGSQIERVEIITNPSARYEAEGMSGIINIVLKKERKEGFNGSFDLIAGHPANYGAAASINYRKKNLNFFVNYTGSYRNTPGRNSLYQELYRNDSTFLSRQTFNSRLNGMYNTARAGIDYYFNDKNILTGSYTWRISKGKRYSDIQYRDYISTLDNLQGVVNRTQDETETEPNSEYALTYKRSFSRKGHELTADLRFLDNWEKSDQYFTEKAYLPDGSPSGVADLLQRSLNDETEKQLLLQIDYVHPFGKEGKLEAGLRSSSRDMTNNFSVTEEIEGGNWRPLDSLTNNFLYEENIHALYGILGNKTGKFSYQVGLRAEWTDVTTTLKQTDEVNPRDYRNLFPSVHLTYDLPKQHALQLSYSRRVRRPQYNDLSPFMTFSDRRNFFSGNPDLNPEFSDSYEIGHIKYLEKGSITTSLYYRYTTGKIIRIRRVNPETGFSTTLPENLATENSFGAEITSSYNPFNWWKMDGSVNFFRAITDGGNLDDSFQSDTYSWFSRLNSRFTFWKGTDFQARGNYEAPQLTPQGKRKAIATLDLAASKDIFKGKGTLTLNVIDVFNSRRFRTITKGENFYTEGNSQGRLRQINLTLNYRLHQAKKKEKPLGDGDF
ncbi:TonB-dependent receptor [Rhodocytophaga rosea]|uniref:TonB-dependent receptor n=1 Tax=Rhodocytophaga rosea TaxID=2704465 RepID=A0A6C0GQ75_9BACT|nr:outer membrane beta-barrel family protein [Rhodocytophaga rosea]QHT70225.1 TonB-dependent receptor [Rhodocytophaga rosea]